MEPFGTENSKFICRGSFPVTKADLDVVLRTIQVKQNLYIAPGDEYTYPLDMGLKKASAVDVPPTNIGENLNKSVTGKVRVPDIYDSLFGDSGAKTSAGDADTALTGGEQ